ncbi:hypothetical protein QTP70_000897 [Hemibagrus guttatus]|uniref:Uncharacterized protein n=1 Tax=Hemibagrus guttatus TaxID=175788 RepID=A0AAE0QK27_9TELE|nr:hypothetical protein QTP70_000897 [Hemibagrus guttatus]
MYGASGAAPETAQPTPPPAEAPPPEPKVPEEEMDVTDDDITAGLEIGKALTALLCMKREQLPGSEITQINNSAKADLRRTHSLAPAGGFEQVLATHGEGGGGEAERFSSEEQGRDLWHGQNNRGRREERGYGTEERRNSGAV